MSGLSNAFDRRFARLAFARRIPLRQILVRAKRYARVRLFGASAPPLPDYRLLPSALLPRAILPPHAESVERVPQGWLFTFLGRTIAMPDRIDWTAPSLDPADQLWRMNLHYMEYLPRLSPVDGGAAIAQWIENNPISAPGALSGGWNVYALSIRVVMWLQFLARPDVELTARERDIVSGSLASQFAYLRANPETDIGGNHLVRNVRALIWGAACAEGFGAAQLRAAGLTLLRKVLATQILPDGAHFELSPSYHCQVLGDLIACRHALGTDAPASLETAIAAMLKAASLLTHRDGMVAQFGDSGLSMAPTLAELRDAASPGEAATATLPVTGILADAGFACWGSARLSLIAKFGRLAADDLPAHGHCDTGSFEICTNVGRLFVDQGVDVYIAGERRDASRRAANHNVTVAGDGRMAGFFGAFRLGWRPTIAGVAKIGDDGLKLTVTHDGFREASGGLAVTRELRCDGEQVEIEDTLTPPPCEPVSTGFLLHPDCQAAIVPGGCRIEGAGSPSMLAGGGTWRVVEAEWWPDMGRRHVTTRVICDWPAGAARNRFVLFLPDTVSGAQ